MRKNTLISVIFSILGTSLASSGDRSPDFGKCVALCQLDQCNPSQPINLPLALRLTRWTCADDCKYTCMHDITTRDSQKGSNIQQYYGKWPFWRLAGMQEPASVAFSLLNLWAHVRGALKVREKIPKTHPMKSYYFTWSLVSINAWFWSSVFHTRDLPVTEKMDYFSAALAIMYALYYTAIRMFHLYPRPRHPRITTPAKATMQQTNFASKAWSFLCIFAYLAHISYLTLLPRFDYTYNMAFNLVLGLGHNTLWLMYSLPTSPFRRFLSQPKSYRPLFSSKAAVFVGLTTAATALELFDFPPWGGIIDAHALWHLVTAPIALFWYNFLIQDSLEPNWREQRI
ncbi:Per1-like protein [Collybia nuda]|uniref:Post-GPI attachment to proteins factor 3 n=1 Tax=Collybia nuda TaxID=64659 RepID=A0A9P5Y9E4_9AGAR|nr:Per1-like protein [Collybia nuda]